MAPRFQVMAERELFAHLLRRATFGPTAQEVDAAEKVGLAATIQRLVRPAKAESVVPPAVGPDPYQALPKEPSRARVSPIWCG